MDWLRRLLGETRRENDLRSQLRDAEKEAERKERLVRAERDGWKKALAALSDELQAVIKERESAEDRRVDLEAAIGLSLPEYQSETHVGHADHCERVVLAGRTIAALTEEVEKHRAAAATVLTFTVEREEFEARMARARESARILRQVEAALERPLVELSHIVCVLAAIQTQVPGHESVLGAETTATGGAA